MAGMINVQSEGSSTTLTGVIDAFAPLETAALTS